MKRLNVILSVAFMLFAFAAFAQPEVEIPNQKPGSCYAKCLIADEYTTETEQIQVKAPSTRVETIPAAYESVSEQVLVRDASSRIERVPAEYESMTQSFVKGCPSGYEPEGGSLVAGGNCVRYFPVPAVYETVTEQVLVKEASTRLEVTPAQYETVTEQIVAKPASFRTETIPAAYESMTEQVLVKEASTRIDRKPARYTTQSEQIETAPASTKWIKKKANRNCLAADPNDCLVWCLVEVPAQYRTVTKKVREGCEVGWTDNGDDCIKTVEIPAEYSTRTFNKLKTAATTRQSEVPAEYKSITKTVVKTPAQTRTVEIPAEYTTRTVRKLQTPASTRTETAPVIMGSYTTRVRKGCPSGYTEDTGAGGNGDCIRSTEIPAEYTSRSFRKLATPASSRSIDIPAEYTTVTRRVLVKKGGFTEFREVICEGDVTNVTVRKIQEALRSRGYDPGVSDNVMGARTKAALVKYQKDNNLPVGNLDLETMKSLGVSN